MKKLLFLTYVYNNEYAKTGIGKKITAQFSTMSKYFEESYISGGNSEVDFINNKEYKIRSKNKFVRRRQRLKLLEDFILTENITHVYIRYTHFADRNFIKFLKRINKNRIIIMEIPTYPYDSEYKVAINARYIFSLIEKKYRNKLCNYVKYIVTFSEDEEIFGIPCINISNGIDFKKMSLVSQKNKRNSLLTFTSVSSCDFWHGIDRFLKSLEQYLEKNKQVKIRFNIVGQGHETQKLKKIVNESKCLSEVVLFHGFKSGKELNEIYDKTDIAVGCLGNHRKDIYTIQALKNKEYAAKGLPMIFSEDDPGLRGKKYVCRVSHNEQLIDIENVINWYHSLKITPQEIRESVKEFSWETQMQKVIKKMKELEK